MKYKLLLIILVLNFSLPLHGMRKIRDRFRKKPNQEQSPTQEEAVDHTALPEQEEQVLQNKSTPDRDAVDQMANIRIMEEIQSELGITQKEVRGTWVVWRHPSQKRQDSDPIIWKQIEVIADEQNPISNQISIYADHYKNGIRWWWLPELVFLRLPEMSMEEANLMEISIPLREYLEWKGYQGMQYKKNALKKLPEIIQKIKDARKPPLVKATSFIAGSLSITAGIKLCMTGDLTNKYLGGAAIGAGLWQWYRCYATR